MRRSGEIHSRHRGAGARDARRNRRLRTASCAIGILCILGVGRAQAIVVRGVLPTSIGLPEVNVVSAPDADKWRRTNPEAIERILPIIEPMMVRLGYDTSSR